MTIISVRYKFWVIVVISGSGQKHVIHTYTGSKKVHMFLRCCNKCIFLEVYFIIQDTYIVFRCEVLHVPLM